MTPLAIYLNQQGHQVAGSDLSDFRMRNALESKGIKVSLFHSSDNCKNADLLLYSTAIPKDNPEIKYAIENHIPILNRLEALRLFLKRKKIIAVTGSYGKSTTTAFTASILKYRGMNPSWLVGADLFLFPPAEYNDSEWMVLETDESKPDFLEFDPYSVLLTNIGNDHLPNYNNSQEKLANTFLQFIKRKNPAGKVYLNADDPFISSFQQELDRKDYVLCGKTKESDYSFQIVSTGYKNQKIKTVFDLTIPCGKTYKCEIPMLGEKNVLDAVLAFALTVDLAGNADQCIQGFPLMPVMDRRFEICSDNGVSMVIDDEGDSPEVIYTVFENAKKLFPNKKIISILQPHRYSRLKNLFQEYVRIMVQGPDEIILLPVFSAGEEEIAGINSETLMKSIIEAGFSPNQIQSLSMDCTIHYLHTCIDKPYLIITLGPGDVWKVANAYRKP